MNMMQIKKCGPLPTGDTSPWVELLSVAAAGLSASPAAGGSLPSLHTHQQHQGQNFGGIWWAREEAGNVHCYSEFASPALEFRLPLLFWPAGFSQMPESAGSFGPVASDFHVGGIWFHSLPGQMPRAVWGGEQGSGWENPLNHCHMSTAGLSQKKNG